MGEGEVMIPISEIFISPQGEGLKTGRMTLFVRVAGCSYSEHPCNYCDTPYAWYPDDGVGSTLEHIITSMEDILLMNRIREICITGGEPLLYYPEIEQLIRHFRKHYSVSIETNGGHIIWRDTVLWSLDLKCPSSGNDGYNRYENICLLTPNDQIKFVISNWDDFCFARDITKSRIVLPQVIFQPAWKSLSYNKLIKWLKEDRDIIGKVIVGTQAHKVWYPRKRRGV